MDPKTRNFFQFTYTIIVIVCLIWDVAYKVSHAYLTFAELTDRLLPLSVILYISVIAIFLLKEPKP